MTTGTGTAQLLFGAAHQQLGGVTPYLSMWLLEGRRARWRVHDPEGGTFHWVPRSSDRVLADALVLLVGLTSSPRDPVPVALSGMAPESRWREGVVDLPTWRHYDADHLDSLVVTTEPAGKVVLSVLPEASLADESFRPLEQLDWDVDVLTPRLSLRRADRDVHQAPPARLPGPALPRQSQAPRAPQTSQRPRWWT